MIRNYFLMITVLFSTSSLALSQSVVSKKYTFSKDDLSELYMPPELYVNIDFDDDNHNQILEATENGVVRLSIYNGGSASDDVTVSVSLERSCPSLDLPYKMQKIKIAKKGNAVVEFPIRADINIPTDSIQFNIKISEPGGFNVDAAMVLSTFEYQKAKFQVGGVSIIDAGTGLRANNPDGKVQKGEIVQGKVMLQNIGAGEATGINYSIESRDPNIYFLSETRQEHSITGTLERMLSGETKELTFRLAVNNNYHQSGQYLPIYITVKEDKNFGNITAYNVPIPLDAVPDKPVIVNIQGQYDKLLAMQQTKVYSSSNRISTGQEIKDISIAPAGRPLYKDAVAVVIGAEKNSYGVAPAPYAARDAEVMAKYFQNSLGVSNVILKTDKEVTGNALSDLFDERYGELKRMVEPTKTDVFVYYSGHGMPEITDGKQDVYLFPYDARKELISERGYSLNKLYANLNSLDARSVTVILDACFSGSSRSTMSIPSENISGEKGVRIAMPFTDTKPWETNPNFRLFTSSTGDQISLGYDQSQSGLFTYFLAVGLQGQADGNSDGNITFDELVKYVSEKVSAKAPEVRRGGNQTPQFFGNGNFIIEKIK